DQGLIRSNENFVSFLTSTSPDVRKAALAHARKNEFNAYLGAATAGEGMAPNVFTRAMKELQEQGQSGKGDFKDIALRMLGIESGDKMAETSGNLLEKMYTAQEELDTAIKEIGLEEFVYDPTSKMDEAEQYKSWKAEMEAAEEVLKPKKDAVRSAINEWQIHALDPEVAKKVARAEAVAKQKEEIAIKREAEAELDKDQGAVDDTIELKGKQQPSATAKAIDAAADTIPGMGYIRDSIKSLLGYETEATPARAQQPSDKSTDGDLAITVETMNISGSDFELTMKNPRTEVTVSGNRGHRGNPPTDGGTVS
ncbi:hypothetical protein KC906_02820, partial [Candidatus Kaiserbacteria bacterium]|nr:hypothetical protein [Candidatus Kaiserbacteria bacterium]